MQTPRYIVISPVRNEAEYLEGTIESMRRQTIQPARWIIVNDGSRDATKDILETAGKRWERITVLHRADRGFRQAGAGVVDAFYDGYRLIGDDPWDYLVKLDGDLSFEPEYFGRCFAYFEEDPRLGIGGGTVCQASGTELVTESSVDPAFHVRGATKIYRRACWDQIGGLIHAPGWDTVDEFKANMLGWRTRTFPDIQLIHHRITGRAYGWSNFIKNGLANYVAGYHPAFMLVKCAKRVFEWPWLVGAMGLWAGFCLGYLRGVPQVPEPDVIRYLRQQQLRRMFLRPSIYSS